MRTSSSTSNDLFKYTRTLQTDICQGPSAPVRTDERPSSRRSTGKPPRRRREPDTRSFVCSTCYQGFYRQEHLVRHNRIHTGEKPYPCLEHSCGRRFGRSDELARHQKVHQKANKKRKRGLASGSVSCNGSTSSQPSSLDSFTAPVEPSSTIFWEDIAPLKSHPHEGSSECVAPIEQGLSTYNTSPVSTSLLMEGDKTTEWPPMQTSSDYSSLLSTNLSPIPSPHDIISVCPFPNSGMYTVINSTTLFGTFPYVNYTTAPTSVHGILESDKEYRHIHGT
ncbi:uncharacterized protein SPPG_03090 [Spizellomyces punctatus DAOM BR117]|uniref:C2H2-type domain-containing protein n=1 Tax=Spizellomyces punctatus (strain DAOM BR117) TaxID=645134 RepID=A0A0L0HK65_SPIPD|nr:uncharacterized protein SPPG_03090 [Spizellomyces punctatus DAOM BR117]KND01280.1 hypothetical protein SPPG_03090 [Spizellomyces punctatus DAOM BR117]|eukprot:XP_016609319.1 hypothetical protein SPPG_03090 [Spizellomyces punctatus DAOM BR117]